jgi:hypothetical protein
LATIAVVSACGGTSSSAISGKTPAQILAQALNKAYGQKFSFTSSTKLTFDVSKVTGFDPSQLGAFGPIASSGLTLVVNGTFESQARYLFDIKIQPLCTGDIFVAGYDGHSFVSTDGKTWADAGATSSTTTPAPDQTQTTTSLNGVGFKDNGSTSQDGQTVQDYRLDFNDQLVQKIAAAAGQAGAASSLSQFLTVNGDGVDIYVHPDTGLPESVKGTLKVTLDVTSLVQLASLAGSSSATSALGALSNAGGKLGLALNEDTQFSNWGSATVSKPSATAGATPSICPELSGLGSTLGGLTGGGAAPTPDLNGLSGGGDVNNTFSNISNGLNTN